MRFGALHRAYFNAEDGGYSEVTPTEFSHDRSVTVTGAEKDCRLLGISRSNAIYQGSSRAGGPAALKPFKLWPGGRNISQPLVFPKGKRK